MSDDAIRIFPLGDSALTFEFGNVIADEVNNRAIALADRVRETGFPGLVETSPAYASTTVFYDPVVVRANSPGFPTAFDAVASFVRSELKEIGRRSLPHDDPIEIAVDFSPAVALDIEHVARTASMSIPDVISIFTSTVYRVYMLGFLPGFAYMGQLDSRIATPRKASPRTGVPAGSVGIAGLQTGIYSLSSPGGWQIIGRTDLEMFTGHATQPCRLKPGDRVKFVAA